MLRAVAFLVLAGPPAGPSPAAPAGPDAGSVDPRAPLPPSEVPESGSFTLGPGLRGDVSIVDPSGTSIARLSLRPEQAVQLAVAPGRYAVRDVSGATVAEFDVAAGQVTPVRLPPSFAAPIPVPLGPPPSAVGPARGPVPPPPSPRARPRWKRWGAPLFSAVTPGVGQMVNRQTGKGVGILLGSLAMAAGSLVLVGVGHPGEGATAGDAGRSTAAEGARLFGISALTGGLGMLYAWQIMDAHAVAAGKKLPNPRVGHKLAIDVVRMDTIGFATNQPALARYTDWTVSLMGQPFKRLTVGASDISAKVGGFNDRYAVQAGLRIGYRFFEHRRIWIGAAVGSLFQVFWARKSPEAPLSDDRPRATDVGFGAAPYAQLELRIFVLDRWSLDLFPRFSMPLTTRVYRFDRALPRYAATFELGTGTSVYF